MLEMRISESEKTVYIEVSGYITTKDANNFLGRHKQETKSIRKSQYRLIVTPSAFECENEDDIARVCMNFYKGGYKKIYIIDPNNYIMNTMRLSSLEKKLFTKAVKLVKSENQIK